MMAKHKLKILSIDGGGIKGIIPCSILNFIEQQTGKKIAEIFHLIAGTSTGGIIATGLTAPDEDGFHAFSAADMLNLYVKNGKDIFSRRPADLKTWLDNIIQDGLFDMAYDVKNFEKLLNQYFGNTKLAEVLSADILVTTYAPGVEKPFYFSSRLAKTETKENFLLKEISRCTSAAPTFFKPKKVEVGGEKVSFVDGGVFANNPAVLAYSEAKEIWKAKIKAEANRHPGMDLDAKAFEPVVSPDDNDLPFFMLSLGCGHFPTPINYSDAEKWRTKDWIQPLLTNVFMQSVSESTHYIMHYLMPPYNDGTMRYVRMGDLTLDENTAEMDNASNDNIEALVQLGEKYVEDNKDKLLELCKLLTDNS
jgi:patatin-like phospholipase/acyl hydrolase